MAGGYHNEQHRYTTFSSSEKVLLDSAELEIKNSGWFQNVIFLNDIASLFFSCKEKNYWNTALCINQYCTWMVFMFINWLISFYHHFLRTANLKLQIYPVNILIISNWCDWYSLVLFMSDRSWDKLHKKPRVALYELGLRLGTSGSPRGGRCPSSPPKRASGRYFCCLFPY